MTIRALFAAVILAACTSCYNPSAPKKISAYKPVLMDRASLDKAIKYTAHQDLVNPGKPFLYGSYVYIPETDMGVHIYDNSSPASPAERGFINIPGVQVVFVKDNIMYADNAADLISIDISAPENPVIINRMADELPGLNPPDNLPLDTAVNQYSWPKNTVIIGWQKIK